MNNNKIKLFAASAIAIFAVCLSAAAQANVDDPCRVFMGSGGRCQTLGSGGRMSVESQILGSGAREDSGHLGSGVGRQDNGQIFGSGSATGGGTIGSGTFTSGGGMLGSGTATGGNGGMIGSGTDTGGQYLGNGGYLGSGNRSGVIGSGTATGGPSTEDCSGGLIGSGTRCRNSGDSLSIWDWLRSFFE